MTALLLSRVLYPVLALGPGRRLGVWFQGCTLACPGCMSVDTWPSGAGFTSSVEEVTRLWRKAVRAGANGLTISGGEPLQQAEGLAELLASVRAVAAGHPVDVLVYTGYEEDELDTARRNALAGADAVVTGRYRAGEPTALIWRGSANQRLTPMTELGRDRYTPFLRHVPERPPLQVERDGEQVWLIGVPRKGTIPRLEGAMRREGVSVHRARAHGRTDHPKM
ncbi:4Fe-4S single cluster domain-containing protein [Actinocorallia sp. B10E7]|uniref:4Fe-4S single cluster domain-containing protein n=1 Tax=Actinocorallia sp. B10E7 TaxID=3153558 RepID=UPI00325D3898